MQIGWPIRMALIADHVHLPIQQQIANVQEVDHHQPFPIWSRFARVRAKVARDNLKE
jgi:hypothetical protein